jgi:predicted alpha/beta-fold hydrolase
MLKITGAAAVLYLLYPLTDTGIKFYYKPTIQNRLRLDGCSTLRSSKFIPTPWLANGYLQAIFGSTRGSIGGSSPYGKGYEFARELITLPDGGTVSIDWAITSVQNVNKILLIAPGLTGGSKSQYIRNAVEEAEGFGFTVGVMHGRGIEGTPITVFFT